MKVQRREKHTNMYLRGRRVVTRLRHPTLHHGIYSTNPRKSITYPARNMRGGPSQAPVISVHALASPQGIHDRISPRTLLAPTVPAPPSVTWPGCGSFFRSRRGRIMCCSFPWSDFQLVHGAFLRILNHDDSLSIRVLKRALKLGWAVLDARSSFL